MEVEGTLVGRTLAGRFRIERCIGRGGMATVYAAVVEAGEGQGKEVALKVVNRELTRDPMVLKRFHREAKAASKLKHRNTVEVYEYGVDGSDAYIAMELAQGVDLLQALTAENPMRQARSALVVAQVCAALSVAHAAGIIHRDLKPENVMLIPDPAEPGGELVKVLDFGIAKIVETAAVRAGSEDEPPSYVTKTALTRVGTIVGTPAYMSPEQCRGGELDGRSDVYSCGVLLYQILTGEVPFTGETPLHTAMRHIHAQPKPPSELRPGLSPLLEKVVLKALAKWPGERHQTAEQMRAELLAALPELPDRGPRDVAMLQAGARAAEASPEAVAATELLIQADPRMVHGALGAGKLGSVRLASAPLAPSANPPSSDDQRTRERRQIARAPTGLTPVGGGGSGPVRQRTGATPTGPSPGALAAKASLSSAAAAVIEPEGNDEPRTQERKSTSTPPPDPIAEAAKHQRERASTERAPAGRSAQGPGLATAPTVPPEAAQPSARARGQSWARPTAPSPVASAEARAASAEAQAAGAAPRKVTLRGAFPSSTEVGEGAGGEGATDEPRTMQKGGAREAPRAGGAGATPPLRQQPRPAAGPPPSHPTETGLTPTTQIPGHLTEKEALAEPPAAAVDDDEPQTFIRNPPPIATPLAEEEEFKRAVHNTLVMEEAEKRGLVTGSRPPPPPTAKSEPVAIAAPAASGPRLLASPQMSAAAVAKTVDAAVSKDARASLDAAYDEGMKRQAPAASGPLRSTLASAKSAS